jgi:glycosyltransferase involved in cell wall biosynthesis
MIHRTNSACHSEAPPAFGTIAPSLSIITPTYNSMQYFRETALSVLQLSVSLEWIIIDDASTDGTCRFVEELAAAHPNISYVFNQSQMGTWANYAEGLQLARGEYVLFLDHDDTLPSSDTLQRGLQFLNDHNLIHVALSKVAYMDTHSSVYKVKTLPFATYGKVISGRALSWTLFLYPTYPLKQGAVVARKSLYSTTGPIFDIDFVLAATRHSDFVLVDGVGLNYRNLRSSASSQRSNKRDRFWIELSRKYCPADFYVLKNVLCYYKLTLGWLKLLYSRFSARRI